MGKKKGDKNGRRRTRISELERVYRAVRAKFPAVVKQRNAVLIGSDALVVQLPKPPRLGLRFWSGANPLFKDAVNEALKLEKFKVELGPEYELAQRGKKVPTVIPAAAYADLPVDAMRRNTHVRACLVCKEVLDQCALTDDEEYLGRAKAAICAHIEAVPEPKGIACTYSGCVHHEDMSRELAMAMLKLAGTGKPWKDVRKVLVATIPLPVSEKDYPEGFDLTKQDATHKHFENLPVSAGDIYIRLGPKKVTAHVWVSPAYSSKREGVGDPATLENLIATLQRSLPAMVVWCTKKFQDMKALAEMDLQFEGGTKPTEKAKGDEPEKETEDGD